MRHAGASYLAVPYVDIGLQHRLLKQELYDVVEPVIISGDFILGQAVAELERLFASLCETNYAIGVGSGTDALILALRSIGIGPGDEVITAPNSFVASASAIVLCGARPVFVDVRDDYNIDPFRIDRAITSRTKAILPVHLTGRPADMTHILSVANKYRLPVIEDAAQAVGARYNGRPVGSLGLVGCFSFHPLKNLNACGDGGIITTNDERIYRFLLKARNHGLQDRDTCEFWSVNSRLDSLHAAMLLKKLQYLPRWTEERRDIAAFYRECLSTVVSIPKEHPTEYAVYNTFVIEAEHRDSLQRYLGSRGVDSKVHYPIPIHQQPAARELGYKRGDFPIAESQATRILSLPVYPGLSEEQKCHVVECVRNFMSEQTAAGFQ